MRSDTRRNGDTVAGVKLEQQHRKHETKRTMISMTSKPVEFSQKQYENEEQFAAKLRNCDWSETQTTTQQARKPERNKQQGRKI
jgi:hypothetical protein